MERERERPPISRHPRRAGSGRFPIKVNTGSGDANADSTSLSAQRTAPPIPTRSHSRVGSQQNVPAQPPPNTARRPNATPLALGNERLRSNSESLLQATRNKRMGMVTRKTSDLGTVPEARQSNLTHFRGLSHGSVMQDRSSGGVHGSGTSSSSSESATELEHVRSSYVRRLSSLPEYKRQSQSPNIAIEGIKGVLYSLALVHPHISSLIAVVRDQHSKRTSLERVFYNASSHVEQLDRQLLAFDTYAEEDEEVTERSTAGVKRACMTCVMAYSQVGVLLLRNVRRMVQDADARYVRTLLLLVFGGLVEVRNACVNLSGGLNVGGGKNPVAVGQSLLEDRSVTPTQDRPNPTARHRNDTIIRRSENTTRTTQKQFPAPLQTTGINRGVNATGTVPSLPNSDETPMSINSSFAMPSRTTTMSSIDDAHEERTFEKIFLRLTNACQVVLKAMPSVKAQFMKCIEACKKKETQMELRALWTTLDAKCSSAVQAAEALKSRLSTIILKQPDVRSDRLFWQLCNTFVTSFVDAAMLIKEAKRLDLIPIEILKFLRPVSKAVKEVGLIIGDSPWNEVASQSHAMGHSQSTLPPVAHAGYSQATTNGTSAHGGPSHSVNSSPYVTPLPATPLSAALGPAAQATVPSSNAGTRNGLFSGNVFERADSLLAMPTSRTMPLATSTQHSQQSSVISPMAGRNAPRAPR
ncbi:MAG: RAM signaling network component [Piccolia ochrophora]|nr:MAG: RAM signaling network component [Piccolia ochrophora]